MSFPDLQRFLGIVCHHADHALYVTTNQHSRPARDLATSSGVHLVDREDSAPWMAGQPLAVEGRRSTVTSARARRARTA